jgi:hypothetical protein
MSFPAPAGHGTLQIKEAGGQPLPWGAIAEGANVRRYNNTLLGVAPCLFGTDADPNSIVTGYIGQFYKDTSGGTTWVKQTGNNTNTGWIAF